MAASKYAKRLLFNADLSAKLVRTKESYQWSVYNALSRYESQWSKVENPNTKDEKDASVLPPISQQASRTESNSVLNKDNSDEDDAVSNNNNKWKLELAWLTKALDPALQLWKWPLPIGNANGNNIQPGSRSFAEILASIQKSKLGVQNWSLSDLTIGLYLVYLQQASKNPFEDVKGVKISNDTVVQDLIYHVELAKGAYRDSAAGLAKNSMLRESNIVKFVRNSSLLRPGYYIGVDTRNKLVIFGIRGTHTVSDLITDIVSSSDVEVNFEGYTTHFGTSEAARWFLTHEMGTIKTYLEKHKVGFRLRLVGHSLGGAIASMLAIMIRKKTSEELGFSPEIVTAVGYGTPPCVSRELADSCLDYVTTVCMQDDIIPRLSVATLMRLRNEILRTDWRTIFEKDDWRSVVDLVTNAKQVVSSVQDVAKKVVDYTKFGSQTKFFDVPGKKDSVALQNSTPSTSIPEVSKSDDVKKERHDLSSPEEELFIPGTVYYLKRKEEKHNGNKVNKFTLWKRHTGEHFQRILLSNNLISDHKCDSHYYALRDVLKGIPAPQT
ncbi:putative fungal lipase-like domain, alpha/Beta hydrolase [Helianthus debilis subsp. tardiflorus]